MNSVKVFHKFHENGKTHIFKEKNHHIAIIRFFSYRPILPCENCTPFRQNILHTSITTIHFMCTGTSRWIWMHKARTKKLLFYPFPSDLLTWWWKRLTNGSLDLRTPSIYSIYLQPVASEWSVIDRSYRVLYAYYVNFAMLSNARYFKQL